VKQSHRIPPSFLLKEPCHRNAAFLVYHADHILWLEWDEVKVDRRDQRTVLKLLTMVAVVRNTPSIPTQARQAINHRIVSPDWFTIPGAHLAVLNGETLLDRDTGGMDLVEHQPEAIPVESRIRGCEVAQPR
jgi:hypothetical protein